jgi:hypothetical protein
MSSRSIVSVRWGAVLLGVVLVVCAQPAKAKSPALRWLGLSLDSPLPFTPIQPLTSLGNRYVVYRERAGEVIVRDTLRHVRVRVAVGEKCVPVTLRWGHVLMQCNPTFGSSDYRLMALDTRQVLTPPNFRGTDQLQQLGRYWLGGLSCPFGPDKDCKTLYLNRHTGERIVEDMDLPRRDPDTEDLAILVPPHPTTYAVIARDRVVVYLAGRRRVLGRCLGASGCGLVEFQANLVIWATPTRVRAYDTRSRKYYLWRVRRTLDRQIIAMAHEVVFGFRDSSGETPWRLYYARRV